MRELYIVGAGGFGKEACWVARCMNEASREAQWDVKGFIDNNLQMKGQMVCNYPILGDDSYLLKECQKSHFHVAIGRNWVRQGIYTQLTKAGWFPATLIHPSAIIAPSAEIGAGVYVGAGSIICPDAKVGNGVIINNRVAVGHDCVVGDFAQLCPGAQINGFCRVGTGAFIGSNASIHPGKKVGEWASVGSNSYVIGNVKQSTTVIGVPAVKI